MPRECSTLVHEWFEQVWNQGRRQEIDRLMAPDAVVHGLKDPGGNPVRGAAGFKPLYDAFRAALPDLRIDVEDCLRDGDTIAFRCTVRGTHTGDGLGVAATHRAVEIQGMGFIRERGGQIVEAWNTFDFLELYRQIGAIP
jgi:steroid delta-isomerase-like uncharacterized protein